MPARVHREEAKTLENLGSLKVEFFASSCRLRDDQITSRLTTFAAVKQGPALLTIVSHDFGKLKNIA